MKRIAVLALALVLASCGGDTADSGMMEDQPGMMADSAAMQDTMDQMMQDTSGMGGMGADTGGMSDPSGAEGG